MNYTTFEGSRKLVTLGLYASTADMCYESMGKGLFRHDPIVIDENYLIIDDVPCWSLGALIDIIENTFANVCLFVSNKEYSCSFNIQESDTTITESFDGETKMAAVLNCIEWLLENNYIKKE